MEGKKYQYIHNRMKWVTWNFMVGFCALTWLTSINVQMDRFLHARPPVIACDEFLGFESSTMFSCNGIVVFLNDFCSKLSIGWNID